MLDLSFFDANKKPIAARKCGGCGDIARSVALLHRKNDVTTDLPFLMQHTVGKVGGDAVLFKYEGQKWGSNDQPYYSNFGKYDNGKREDDTGFSCEGVGAEA